ncbi:MAG: class I SAM-dependent methyltransferase [Desulfovibrionaceae bacterium]|nr:class I SAM-dependent methyltransferase [Desulfovibrionaceae bacterium]
MDQRAYWERVSSVKTYTTPLAVEPFTRLVPRGARVLDAGCGYGRTLAELADLGYRPVGADFAHAALARGRAMGLAAPLAVGSALALPFAAASFDAVVLLAVLTCVVRDADQRAVVAEARRVLRPGGALLVNDFLLGDDARNRERYARFAPVHGTYGVFEVDGNALVRHHDPAWIDELLAPFAVAHREEHLFTTMNGNTARGFTYLGLAPNPCPPQPSDPQPQKGERTCNRTTPRNSTP